MIILIQSCDFFSQDKDFLLFFYDIEFIDFQILENTNHMIMGKKIKKKKNQIQQ